MATTGTTSGGSGEQESYILQTVEIGGQEFDLSFLTECLFVETADLSGPQLVVKFHQRYSYLKDELGIQEGMDVKATLADPFVQEGMDTTQEFTLLSDSVADGILTIQCLQTDMLKAKKPTVEPQFFVEKPLKEVLKGLIPVPQDWQKTIANYTSSGKHDNSQWPDRELSGKSQAGYEYADKSIYHLIEGQTPAKLVRRIARRHGAFCFYNSRTKKLVFRKPADFVKEERIFSDYQDRTSESQVMQFALVTQENVINDRVLRNFRGWDMLLAEEDGRVKGTVEESPDGEKLPMEMVSLTDPGIMDNLNKIHIPVINVVIPGNGHLRPGLHACMTWNRMADPENPFDESLPKEALVGNVSHHYTPQRYYCRFTGYKWE